MMRFVGVLIAGIILSGCNTPGSVLSRHFGASAGGAVAGRLPPPAAAVVTTQRGGNFCDTARALGAPLPPAGPRRQYEFILGVNEHGERAGCWRPMQ